MNIPIEKMNKDFFEYAKYLFERKFKEFKANTPLIEKPIPFREMYGYEIIITKDGLIKSL